MPEQEIQEVLHMLLSIIYFLIVGLCAGYLSSRLLGLDSTDITKNLITGIVGSLVGGLIGNVIGLRATNLIGSIILAIIGAVAAIVIYRRFIRR